MAKYEKALARKAFYLWVWSLCLKTYQNFVWSKLFLWCYPSFVQYCLYGLLIANRIGEHSFNFKVSYVFFIRCRSFSLVVSLCAQGATVVASCKDLINLPLSACGDNTLLEENSCNFVATTNFHVELLGYGCIPKFLY